MTRVAVVANADVVGGAERYLADLYADGGLPVDATLVGRLPGWDKTGRPSISLSVGPKWSRRNVLDSAQRLPGERRVMLDTVRAAGVDWAHLQYKREQVLLTAALGRRQKVLWTEHGTLYAGRGSAPLRAAYAVAARRAATVICVSTEVADSLRPVVGPRCDLRVVGNPVDTKVFRPPTEDERAAARHALLPPAWRAAPVAVVAARLHPAKRLDRVIGLCAVNGLPLLVAGDGPDRSRLAGLADGAQVRFLGHRDDLVDVLRAADLAVFSASAVGEGQPLSVLEAAATGLPVAGFRGDTANGLITALGGVLVDGPADRLPPPDLAAGATGREYVREHHSPRRWRAAYADALT